MGCVCALNVCALRFNAPKIGELEDVRGGCKQLCKRIQT